MVDAELLDEAVRLSGAKTYSAVVGMALAEYVRRILARQILNLRGAWEGDLSEMRGDDPNLPKWKSGE